MNQAYTPPGHAGEAHHQHNESHASKSIALSPTPSLLRLSALQRLAGAAALSALLWAATWMVLG